MSVKLKANEKVHYIASTTFTLDRKYCELKPIGKGSYGIVCKAFNSLTKAPVAIKKITPMTRSVDDAKHVLREIRLMRHLGRHENIVTLVNLSVRESSDELYIIMDLLDSDLHRVLQSAQELSENHFRYFMFQMLCGIKYMHMNRIIHRDLKPGNLLISKDCKLRITDFGLARERPMGLNMDNIEKGINAPMTEHVVTRWYRSPELMLCPDGLYDYSVDMWSAGCIFAEMLGRKPLFPGKNFVHQLSLIFDIIGMPKPNEVNHIQNSQAKKFLHSQKDKVKVEYATLYPTASASSHVLLDRLLVFVPERRYTADLALKSTFMTEMNYPIPEYPVISSEFEFQFERKADVTISQLKRWIAEEATKIHMEADRIDRLLIAKLPLAEQELLLGNEEVDEVHPSTGRSASIIEEINSEQEKERIELESKKKELRRKESNSKLESENKRESANKLVQNETITKKNADNKSTSKLISMKPAVPKLSQMNQFLANNANNSISATAIPISARGKCINVYIINAY